MDISTRTDEELLLLCSTSADAQEELIGRYARTVRAYARRYFLLGGDYDDLVQEGMIGLLFAIRQYRQGAGSFPAFAAYCIKNKLISAVRGAAAKKHAPLNDSVSIFDLTSDQILPASVTPDPEELLIDRERYETVLLPLREKLSKFEQKVLDAYLEGLSCAEIAEQFDKTSRSVVNAVHRIKLKAADHFPRR